MNAKQGKVLQEGWHSHLTSKWSSLISVGWSRSLSSPFAWKENATAAPRSRVSQQLTTSAEGTVCPISFVKDVLVSKLSMPFVLFFRVGICSVVESNQFASHQNDHHHSNLVQISHSEPNPKIQVHFRTLASAVRSASHHDVPGSCLWWVTWTACISVAIFEEAFSSFATANRSPVPPFPVMSM